MPMTDDDTLFHALFAHPVMVRDLLTAFLPAGLTATLDLDLERMERGNVTFHEALKKTKRTGDVVWRIGTRGGDALFLALHLEFQGAPQHLMAVRALVYQGLLWQQLADAEVVPRSGPLPPLLTLVLYHGPGEWWAAETVAPLIGLAPDSPLWPWQPEARYLPLAIQGPWTEELERPDNLAALLFRLKRRLETPEEIAALTAEVTGWFTRHPEFERLKELFTLLVRETIRSLDPTARVPETLEEITTMVAWNVQYLKDKMHAEGRAIGIAEGLAEGEARGLAEGEARGLLKGRAETLLRLIRRRFGAVPAEAEERVRAADIEALDRWADRVLDAPTLDAVFDDTPSH